MSADSANFLKRKDVNSLVKEVTFDNVTRLLTVTNNDSSSSNHHISKAQSQDVSNLIKSGSFNNTTRILSLGHNDADANGQNASVTLVNIPETDLSNYYDKSDIDSELSDYYNKSDVESLLDDYYDKDYIDDKDYMENKSNIKPDTIKVQNDNKLLWDDHSDRGLWMQDSTWVRFNARIYTESNYIATHGRIGAGTVNPGQPLHVAGKAYISSGMHVAGNYQTTNFSNSAADYITKGISFGADPPNLLFGIKCDQAIHCSYLIVTSDKRIKEDIKDIEDDVALKQLRLLEPKTYKYKDKLDKGNREVIGFIAQEVREVLPNAVKLDQRAIPNILKPCCAYNESQDILELKLDSPLANDITSKEIQIYVNDVSYIVKVILCEGQSIHIKKPDEMADFDGKNPCFADGDRALVYGEYVDDFHLLDKSAIFTIATAAVQELDRQLQAQKEMVSSLEARIIALEEKI